MYMLKMMRDGEGRGVRRFEVRDPTPAPPLGGEGSGCADVGGSPKKWHFMKMWRHFVIVRWHFTIVRWHFMIVGRHFTKMRRHFTNVGSRFRVV